LGRYERGEMERGDKGTKRQGEGRQGDTERGEMHTIAMKPELYRFISEQTFQNTLKY
jgi:hypothetical protein